MSNTIKVFIHTFGCKINQYETQALKEKFEARPGIGLAQDLRDAHCIVINSCAVTSRAVQDVRKTARYCYRNHPGVSTIITGCAVKHFREELGQLPGVAMLVPQEKKGILPDYLQYLWGLGNNPDNCVYGPVPDRYRADKEKSIFQDLTISEFPRARPVVKVQDGCSRVCSYCIVPFTRGAPRSRDPEDILSEIRRLYRNGYREVVLSGINLAQYQYSARDLQDFWDLVDRLDKTLSSDFGPHLRMRLSSLDPSMLNPKGLNTLIGSELVCPHLHISLQSASEKILFHMGRSHYNSSDIERFILELNKYWRTFALGVDILLGFPGESREDFSLTYRFVRDLPFTYGHVFVFSPRPGTRAFGMSSEVSGTEKKFRSREMQELLRAKKIAFWKKLQRESRVNVVLEQKKPMLGMNEYYTLNIFSQGRSNFGKGALIEATPLSASEQGIYCLVKRG